MAKDTPAQIAQAARSVFTIASYNIHQCVGRDGRCDPERIARVIDELAADVIGLQEVGTRPGRQRESYQMAYLAERLGLTAVAGPTMKLHDGDYGNVLLTRWPVRAVRHIELSFLRYEPRRAIDADIDLAGRDTRVVVTHLGLRPVERRFQVRILLEAIAARPSPLMLVLGDINEWLPNGRPLRWLNAALGRSAVLRTFPSSYPIAALDRIWAQPAQALTEIHVHDSPLCRLASDHLPVSATVTLPCG
jgi:endonuclease/exonuclease/phosphatase family metal-dependent hydrolase